MLHFSLLVATLPRSLSDPFLDASTPPIERSFVAASGLCGCGPFLISWVLFTGLPMRCGTLYQHNGSASRLCSHWVEASGSLAWSGLTAVDGTARQGQQER